MQRSALASQVAEVLFACVSDENGGNGKEVGIALFFHNFSTFLGRAGIYLEDLFVLPEYRGKGCGKGLLKKLAQITVERGCGRLYICATFGLFSNGLDGFDKAYRDGIFDRLLTTNLVYQRPDLLEKEYYISCDMSKYIALIIDTLNHDLSVSHLLDPVDRIKRCVEEYKKKQA